jgi:predicted transcriptional regulator of viral defense system
VLSSLERSGLVRRLRPGLWALHADVNEFALAPYLTAPFPGYISLWSALARHDMIEQIPGSIFVATTSRTGSVVTAVGTYSLHHLAPEVFGGYAGTPESGYLATAEKALFDSVYTRVPRGRRLFFPELSLPSSFDEGELWCWTQKIASRRLRTLVERGLLEALRQATSKDE